MPLYLNEEGRDELVRQLQRLSRTSDHVHLGPTYLGELELRRVPYEAGETVLQWGKILLRPDDWDAEYYPHVLDR